MQNSGPWGWGWGWGYRWWKTADFWHSARTAHSAPPHFLALFDWQVNVPLAHFSSPFPSRGLGGADLGRGSGRRGWRHSTAHQTVTVTVTAAWRYPERGNESTGLRRPCRLGVLTVGVRGGRRASAKWRHFELGQCGGLERRVPW